MMKKRVQYKSSSVIENILLNDRKVYKWVKVNEMHGCGLVEIENDG